MTEAEWLALDDPIPMLEFFRDKASDRKLRLFAVAYCRNQMDQTSPKWLRQLVNTLEGYTEGTRHQIKLFSKYNKAFERLQRLRRADSPLPGVPARHAALTRRERVRHLEALVVACGPSDPQIAIGSILSSIRRSPDLDSTQLQGIAFLRDIFGNPFRPISFNSSWLTSTVTALAQQMYDSRDFSAMPILADALQDASCDNEDILNHCRGPGPHVRGCFLVDLLLGRE
jgi:hypothetical protein